MPPGTRVFILSRGIAPRFETTTKKVFGSSSNSLTGKEIYMKFFWVCAISIVGFALTKPLGHQLGIEFPSENATWVYDGFVFGIGAAAAYIIK
jgi:hypothetical protein